MQGEDELIKYAIAVLPLTLAHLCIPPLSTFQFVPEPPPPQLEGLFVTLHALVPALQDRSTVTGLLLDPKEDVDATLITHLFVHASYSHLLGNLLQALVLGWPVYRDLGPLGFYALFLAGGVAGSANMQQLMAGQQSVPDDVPHEGLLGWALAAVTNAVKDVVSAVEPRILCCGSSGAVFALYGYNVMTAVWTLAADLKHMLSTSTLSTPPRLIARVAENALTVYVCASVIAGELDGAAQQTALLQGWLGWASARSITGHTAHLRGFALGAAVGLALRLLPIVRGYVWGGVRAGVGSDAKGSSGSTNKGRKLGSGSASGTGSGSRRKS